jgi:NADP-dependent 3-hydroxy acid dehydrogenase YdfG
MMSEPELLGQTIVVIGGSAGIGLEKARRAKTAGADVILTGRNPDRLEQAARDVGAQRTAAFDVSDSAAVRSFFAELAGPIDHVMVTAGGPNYGPLLEMDLAQVREAISGHVVCYLDVGAQRRGENATWGHAGVHGRHRWAPHRSRPRHRLGGHRHPAAVHGDPCA